MRLRQAWLWMAACGCADVGLVEDDWPGDWIAFEQDVVGLVNEARAAGAVCGAVTMPGGQVALEDDVALRQVAREHSTDMADRAFFDHINPDGDDPFDRIAASGFSGSTPWGENLAWGAPDPEMVAQGWLGSPPHCENLMLPDYRVIGMGYFSVPEDPMGHFWTQLFAASH